MTKEDISDRAVNAMRALFPQAEEGSPMKGERHPLTRLGQDLIEQMIAHDLAYRADIEIPASKAAAAFLVGHVEPTHLAQVRLLNVRFTEGLKAVAARQPYLCGPLFGQRHSSIGDPSIGVQKSDERYAFNLALATNHLREMVRSSAPNVFQELFIQESRDLAAYFDGHRIPSAAFLAACVLFLRYEIRRSSPNRI